MFAFQMPDGLFRFGRVIRTDTRVGGVPGAILIYLYTASSQDIAAVPSLRKDELLAPPMAIDRDPWLDGYFQTIGHQPLDDSDILDVHCFWSPVRSRYLDADGNKLPHRIEPCGFFGLGNSYAVNRVVSEALGMPRAEREAPQQDEAANGGERDPRDQVHSVVVHLAQPGVFDLSELEDGLEDAMDKAGAGELDGHEIPLTEAGFTRIFLYEGDPDQIANAILPVLRDANVPRGSFIIKRYKDRRRKPEKIEITPGE